MVIKLLDDFLAALRDCTLIVISISGFGYYSYLTNNKLFMAMHLIEVTLFFLHKQKIETVPIFGFMV